MSAWALAVLIGVDAILLLIAWKAPTSPWGHPRKGLPFSCALVLCLLAVLFHFGGIFGACLVQVRVAGGMESSTLQAIGTLSILTGLGPALALGRVMIDSASEAASGLILPNEDALASVPDVDGARALFVKGDLEGALREYRWVARNCPASPIPRFGEGAVLEGLGRYDEAATVYRRLMKEFENDQDTWATAGRRLADLLREKIGNTSAADYLLRVVEQRTGKREEPASGGSDLERRAWTGNRPMADLDKARALARAGDVDGAVRMFREVFRVCPTNYRPLMAAAMVLEERERWCEAVDVLQELMRIFERNTEVWADSALRLANLRLQHLQEEQAGRYILQEILRRARGARAAALARERLARLSQDPDDAHI